MGKAQNSIIQHNIAKAKEQVTLKIAEYQTDYYKAIYVEKSVSVNVKLGDWIAEKHGGEVLDVGDYEFQITGTKEPYTVTILKNNRIKDDIIGNMSADGQTKWADEAVVAQAKSVAKAKTSVVQTVLSYQDKFLEEVYVDQTTSVNAKFGDWLADNYGGEEIDEGDYTFEITGSSAPYSLRVMQNASLDEEITGELSEEGKVSWAQSGNTNVEVTSNAQDSIAQANAEYKDEYYKAVYVDQTVSPNVGYGDWLAENYGEQELSADGYTYEISGSSAPYTVTVNKSGDLSKSLAGQMDSDGNITWSASSSDESEDGTEEPTPEPEEPEEEIPERVEEEREEDYIEDVIDENAPTTIVLDEDIEIDENAEKTDLEEVPAGWIGIYTESDLIDMKDDLGAKYILMNDLTLKKTWTPLGKSNVEFTGYFNGNGYTIENLTVTGTSGYLGMFAKIGGTGNITNLNLKNYSITGKSSFIGGLAGYNKGNISNVSATGTITMTGGSTYVGGLVGYHAYYSKTTTKIEQVYTGGSIGPSTYGTYVGGIAGAMQGYSTIYKDSTYIKDSYTTMKVQGSSYVAGIVSRIYYSNIKNVYTIGQVVGSRTTGGCVAYSLSSYAENVYWEKMICGQSTSKLGTQKTLTQLTKKATYEGYDFENVWNIDQGTSTAYLRNQDKPSKVTEVVEGYEEMLGDGTAENPYQIRTVAQLKNVALELDAHYILMANIDLSSESNWTPIGTNTSNAFTGDFNGNGYTISNMKINSTTAYKGLFGYAKEAYIYDLNLIDYEIITSGNYVGAIVGYMDITELSKIHTKGKIIIQGTSSYIGGVVGYMKNSTVGGYNCTLSKCYSEGEITYSGTTKCGSSVGGLVGWAQGNKLNSSNPEYAGIGSCCSTVDITASSGIGGIIGTCANYTEIINSYATGNINGGSTVGTIVGNLQNYTIIGACYGVGKISANTYGIYGPVTTVSNVTVENSYYNNEQCQVSGTPKYGEAKTISHLVKKGNYTDWDFENVWEIDEGKSLAYLKGMPIPSDVYSIVEEYPPMDGLGTIKSPFIIKNANQLNRVRYDLDAEYELGANIDLSQYDNWTPIGTQAEPFIGYLDGKGYTISNMKINSTTAYKGLFGYATNAGIHNFELIDYEINTSGNYVGAVIGYIESSALSGIHTKGKITMQGTSSYVGGVVGYMKISTKDNTSYIGNSYSEGEIMYSGTTKYGSNVGGLVGYALGHGTNPDYVSIYYCYSNVNIKASSIIGGLVSCIVNTELTHCYATGNITGGTTGGLVAAWASNSLLIADCFWDTTTSGQTTSKCGTGLTTSQMKDQANFTNWNFEKTWIMKENSYPKLRFFEE